MEARDSMLNWRKKELDSESFIRNLEVNQIQKRVANCIQWVGE